MSTTKELSVHIGKTVLFKFNYGRTENGIEIIMQTEGQIVNAYGSDSGYSYEFFEIFTSARKVFRVEPKNVIGQIDLVRLTTPL